MEYIYVYILYILYSLCSAVNFCCHMTLPQLIYIYEIHKLYLYTFVYIDI